MNKKKEKVRQKIHPLHRGRYAVAVVVFGFFVMTFVGLAPRAQEGNLPFLQLVPAVLALNVVVVALLLLATLLFGRVYCSLLCPLGLLQDVISRLSSSRSQKAARRFSYTPAKNWLRYPLLLLFLGLLVAGFSSLAGLLEPYSAFGRIMTSLVAPLYTWANNGFAWLAEQVGLYWPEEREVWVRSWGVLGIAVATLLLIAVLAWRHGRAYCNTLCPVGTLLGLLARVAPFGIRINEAKCVSCGLCAKQCKASCIHAAEHRVDASRCVACMSCLTACHQGAVSYGLRWGYKGGPDPVEPKDASTLSAAALEELGRKGAPKPQSPGRRHFLLGTGMVLATATRQQQEKLTDGGLAPIAEKEVAKRCTPIVPAGAVSLRHVAQHCTGCQLCIAACPNGVLRPSATLQRLMQPECSFERGYCRPECTRCAEVCPAGALSPISDWQKASTQVGHAVWVRAHCVVLTNGVRCGNCARHCPTGAITMVPLEPNDPNSPEIPVVDEERCIGCGACEHLCPARPQSAMYVEGHEVHRSL